MKQLICISLFCLSVGLSTVAQELNCEVSIIASNKVEVNTNQQEILNQLETIMRDFLNETKWTNDEFELEERINCQIQFQLENIPQPGVYEGKFQIQSSRPVFNSSYNTILLNYVDEDVSFSYTQNMMLNYSPNQFRDNLTSMLAYYAYYIIGMDYDSYGLKSGKEYLQTAQDIVINAQSSGGPGWSPDQVGNKNNRYWIIDNALQELYQPLRECIYIYHRNGLDQLYQNKDAALKQIYNALNKLPRIVASRPGTLNVTSFVQAKRNELKQIFKEAPVSEKTKLVELLKRLDPTHSEDYEEILR